jgi:hypothetical protein
MTLLLKKSDQSKMAKLTFGETKMMKEMRMKRQL